MAPSAAAPPAAPAGRSAFEYRVTSDFTFESFKGNILSYKRYLSERSGYRLGLSGNLLDSEADGDRWVDSSEAQGATIELQVLRFADLKGRTRMYWGIGPRVGYWQDRDERDRGDLGREIRDYDSWSASLGAVIGVEFWTTSSLALTAEYGLAATYREEDSLEEVIRPDTTISRRSDRTTWSASGEGGRLGLSVIF